eukprot:SAG22_NODE_6288_length_874_cov_1.854194_2_plen_74_part_01
MDGSHPGDRGTSRDGNSQRRKQSSDSRAGAEKLRVLDLPSAESVQSPAVDHISVVNVNATKPDVDFSDDEEPND